MIDSSQLNSLLMSLSRNILTGDLFIDFVLMMVLTKLVAGIPFIWEKIEAWMRKTMSKFWLKQTSYMYSFVIKYDKMSSPSKDDLSVSIHADNEIIINGILEHLKNVGAISCSIDQEIFNLCHMSDNKSRKEELLESQLLEYPLRSIQYDDMSFQFNMDYKINSEDRKSNITYNNEITIYSNDRAKIITFIDTCKRLQIEREYKHDDEEEDDKKIMYYYFLFKRCDNEHRPMIFKRYSFTTRKTFDSVFFDRKDEVLATIQDFLNKRGSWDSKRQRTNKLFILLYGPPGSGKTSFIKALCNLTKRSPVKIGLDKFNTNEELLDVFCNPMIRTIRSGYGDDVIRLPIAKRINILEDVDCDKCDHIIKPRDQPVKEKEKGEEKKDDENESKIEEKLQAKESTVEVWKRALSDITLSGLLQVTDGLYEPNDAMAVFTTNDISKFDKALIRPGRMDIILYMGYISYRNMTQLVTMYYGDEVDLNRLPDEQIWNNSLPVAHITPSDVEAVCQYCPTFELASIDLTKLPQRLKTET